MAFPRQWTQRLRRRIWLRRAARYAYNLTLLGFGCALGAGALAWLYLAPPSPPIRLSAAAAPNPPWQLAAWRERAPATRWQQRRQLQSGENLREFLRQQNIADDDAEAALAVLAAQYDWRKFEGGQKIALLFAAPPAPMPASHPEPHNVRFDGLSLSLPPDHWLVLRQNNGWQLVHHVAPMPSRLMLAEGEMASDLYAAARRAGLPPPLAEDWLRLLAYRLHPAAQDWRGGQFQVIYRQKSDADGRWLADGEIVFFALRHNRRTQAFWRFLPSDSSADETFPQPAYVNRAGESLALRFMPTPLAALPRLETSAARYHARYGPPSAVQRFAAPDGTQVLAAADGTVQTVGESARDGKFVQLAHADGYESFYAQLQTHAPGLIRGRQLRQGEPLGTLGMPLLYVLRHNGMPLPPAQNWAARQVLGEDAARAFAAWRARQEKQLAILTARQRSLARSAP